MGKFNTRRQALVFAAIALMAASCGRAERRAREEQELAAAAKERQEYVADSTRRADKQKRSDYYEHVRDSVAQRNGEQRYSDSLASGRGEYEDEEAIRTIKWAHSLAGTMERELMTAGEPIIQHGEQEIRDLLAKYNVSYTDFFVNDEYNWYLREELFVGVSVREDGQVWQMFGATRDWQAHVDAIIDKSDYGEPRKAEMKQKVAEIIAGTEQKLIASRKNVEARFADYYSAMPQEYKDEMGISYGGEGVEEPGYEVLNWNYGSAGYATKRSIHVYDSKLDVDFFGEPGATYKLVSLGNNKWQVVKTRADGTVAKTAVFEDEHASIYTSSSSFRDVDEEGKPVSVPRVGDSDFSFYAGKNMGVHIDFSEIIKVERNNKQWKDREFTPEEQRQMDSLRERIAKKNEWYDKQRELGRQSDSIARAMTQRRFGNRGQ